MTEIAKRHAWQTFISRDVRLLHPEARDAFSELAIDLQNQFDRKETPTNFRLFEAYRSPARQQYLFEQDPPVTKAGPWRSAHNFGLACDYVAYVYQNGQYQWSWDDMHDWPFLKHRAAIFGLKCPIEWDRGHVEHPYWHENKFILQG